MADIFSSRLLKTIVFGIFGLLSIESFSQTVLRPGTNSNRGTGAFYDMTSWDSKYYNGNTSSPGYAEGWLAADYGNNNYGYMMNYRLQFPMNYNPNENYKYPLIIMMHGLGERGETGWTSSNSEWRNNDLNLVNGGQVHMNSVYLSAGKKAEDPTLPTRAFPGFVLFPQTADRWYDTDINKATDIVEKVIAAYNIDPDRVYIHGLSNGGEGTWLMVSKKPQLYAAALPMSATVNHESSIFTTDIAKIVSMPYWIFQGGQDKDPSPNNTGQVVSKLKTAGGNVRYTLYPNIGHGVWGTAYNETEFFSWMLAKNKSDISVLYLNPKICSTTQAGAKLAVGVGFQAYQWEKDGVTIAGATSATYTATQAGTYRARYSRVASPTEEQWNKWSKPVVITESTPVTPSLSTNRSPLLPDINLGYPDRDTGGGTTWYDVRIQGPTTAGLTKVWSYGGTQQIDTANYITRSINNYNIGNANWGGFAGTYTLQTKTSDGCPSLPSNPINIISDAQNRTTLVAPVNFQAQVNSSTSIQLFWADSSKNETGYEIQRATVATGPYTFYKYLGEDVVSYNDTGLVPNTTYYYKIRATNASAVSPYNPSNLVATTTIDTQAPTPPTGITKVDNTIYTIAIKWTASTDNSGIQKYKIYYGSTIIDTGSTATSYSITGLTPNTNYAITIKAVDLYGNESQPSEQFLTSTYFTGLNYQHTPDDVSNTSLHNPANSLYGINWGYYENSGNKADFSISPRVQDNYFNFKFEGYIYITTAGDYTFSTNSDDGSALYLGAAGAEKAFLYPATNWQTTNRIVNNDGPHGNTVITSSTVALAANTYYPIAAIYFELTGGESLIVQFTGPDSGGSAKNLPYNNNLRSGVPPVLTPPVVPTALSAMSAGMTSITLSWTHASATDDFEIYRSADGTNFSIIATATTDGIRTFTNTGLSPFTTYYYKIRSINLSGSSPFTAVVNAKTDADSAPPSIPQNVTVLTNTYTNAGLKWDASTDNVGVTGYKIFANGNLLGTSTSATYFTTALSPSTLYNFTVTAYDATGNESTASSTSSVTTSSPAKFYSTSGNLNLLPSWNTKTDGTGTAPTDFSFNGQQFIIQSSITLSSAWVLGGGLSRVIVNPNVILTLQQKLTGKINLTDSASVIVNYTENAFNYDFDDVSATSTVIFNNYSIVPIEKYGNLMLNDTGVKSIPSGLMEVQGTLTLANGIELKGAALNGTSIKIKGNLSTGTTTSTVSADNLVALQFTDNDFHTFTLNSAQNFYRITANANSFVSINNNTSPFAPKLIKLGSLNGGGLELSNGSVFSLGKNSLSIIGAGTINTTNTTGQLSMLGGDIQLTTSSSSPSNFYFVTGANQLQNFTLQSSGGGLTSIRQPLEIYDGVKINAGTLSSGGNITLKSSASASASIRQIVSGGITGNVTVERYMAALPGSQYRYLSSPVAGVTVANWQMYIPITGTFTNASTGLGTNPSMFTYTEPNYTAFPATSNSQQLQQGRGYATYMYNSSAQTLQSTGVPYQGTVSFTSLLTPDTNSSNPDDGWNLLGNPYASDIVWNGDATVWGGSGVGNVIAISDNTSGELVYQYWDHSGSGSGDLERGKIPAGQAFWVQSTTTSPSLTVNEGAKTADLASDNTEFYRTSSTRTSDYNNAFSFELDNGVNKDVAYVKFTDNGLDSYTKQTDGAKKQNSIFNLSTSSTDGVALAMNDLSNQFCEKIIPVNIKDAIAGNYHLKFNNTDQFVMSNIVLQDKYLGTEQAVNASNKDFTIVINSDAASAQNRFYLKLFRPDVLASMTAASDKKNFCSSEGMVTVTINNSQPDVDYTAFVGATSTGVMQTGNGDDIQLQVPVSLLAANQNNISIQAAFPGCTAKSLDKIVVVNKTAIPELTGTTDYYGCVGSAMDVKVSSSSAVAYHWKDITNSKALTETTGTLSISQLGDINYYAVTATDVSGCESVVKNILVRSDTLATPVVAIKNELLSISTKSDDIQWLLNGQIIPDAISPEYTPSVSGDYVVKVANNYCVKESEPVAFIVTGLDEPANGALSLQLYPNPSERGDVTITGQSNSTSSLQIQFLDLAGRQLITRETSYEEYAKGIKVKGELSAGAYIVRVIQDGTIRFKKLLVL